MTADADRVRIAPSPTGPLHIGTARTALFNYLFARRKGGTFILRLEDTDVGPFHARLRAGHPRRPALAGASSGTRDPRLPGSRPAVRSGRTARCSASATRRLASGCWRRTRPIPATARGRSLTPTRRRRPPTSPRITSAGAEADALRSAPRARPRDASRFPFPSRGWGRRLRRPRPGPRRDRRRQLGGDLVIVRADGTPLYHFTVVVDDAAMQISHVIRGEDHLSNTPKQILLFRALGRPAAVRPPAAHPEPRPDQDEQAQEPDGDRDYIDEGFIREALVNYLALLGWSSGTEEEILPLDELVKRFDLAGPQGRGGLRSRAARMAQRPVDPAARPDELVERLRPFLEAELAARPDRPDAVRPGDRALLPLVSGAAADPGRDRRSSASCSSTTCRSIRPCSCPSAGTRRRRSRLSTRRAT